MAYPYPQNITNLKELIDYVNTITNNWFAPSFLFMIFCIAFISIKTLAYKTHQAFAAAAFITFIIATIFRILGFIGTNVLIFSIIALVVAIIWLFFAEKVEF
ncbi:MAG: hypothetical protein QXS37_01545 [Candidatus Aenigmatarchaeota archaeon]